MNVQEILKLTLPSDPLLSRWSTSRRAPQRQRVGGLSVTLPMAPKIGDEVPVKQGPRMIKYKVVKLDYDDTGKATHAWVVLPDGSGKRKIRLNLTGG